jgi:hypothetical protein
VRRPDGARLPDSGQKSSEPPHASQRSKVRPPDADKSKPSDAAGAEAWGSLPAVIVEHLDAVRTSPFLARYREALEAYFKKLADSETSTASSSKR